ncbi:hypothetical protein PQU94_14230 [Asticcacaulis sp. DXS10W]|uniref:Carboxypeptidase regulatory-like domain-containing protein n=1 Tax=Asticcacaulis currens TaxID=2984210 RepID=A0ABT5IGY4_9CAUL|nr:hypothetical protein [Asticcacaulis currens]MDC7695435.1 hypothetical protein [Asticcacaulis currens]
MTPSVIVALMLLAAVVLSTARLGLWWRKAEAAERSLPRLVILLALTPVSALLLYLILFPPRLAAAPGTLIVATRGAQAVDAQAGDRVVALPEANVPGAERVPDLATALRLHPEATRLTVVGDGLTPRDRAAVEGRALRFVPSALPRGVVRLDTPERVAPGGAFQIGVTVNGMKGGMVELLDPAGAVVDTQTPDASGLAVLTGTAKAAGPVSFTVRVRDFTKAVVETAEAPVWVDEALTARVRVIGGAPGPEIKYLRRWAADAGIDMQAQFALGGGVAAGDAPQPLTAATLSQADLLVIDERGWEGLGDSGRAAVVSAVRGGMGLLLRPTALPSEATSAQWAALGLRLSGTGDPVTVSLPVAAGSKDKAPTVTRLNLRLDSADAVPLAVDSSGQPLGLWRAEGRGRVGLWSVTDSFALTLSGEGGRHQALWSGLFSTLVRRSNAALPTVTAGRVHQRVSLCGLSGAAEVLDPQGGVSHPVVDTATGEARCAAVWPAQAGWHVLRVTTSDTVQAVPFYVLSDKALPGVQALEARESTQALVADDARPTETKGEGRRGTAGPWFLGWLLVSAVLWWVERNPIKGVSLFGKKARPTKS